MSFRKNLFKNIIILGGYSYSSQIIGFMATIVLSRLLLPEEYGFVALITVFTGFVLTFSDAGLSMLIIRSDYGRTFHRSIHYFSFILGVILFLLVLLLAWPISLFYKDPALIIPTMVMSFNFLIRSLIPVPYGILSKNLKFNALGSLELICSSTEVVFMIILAFLGFSYWSLIIPSLIGSIVRVGMYYYKVRIPFKIMKRKYLVVAFRMSKSIVGNYTGFTFLNYWARNSDNLVIGRVYGAASLGIYNRAYRLLNMVLSIMTGLFGKVLYPSLKDLMNKGGDVNREYMNLLGIISLINFPLAVLFIFFSDPFVTVLWSERWIQVAELLPYVGVLVLTQTLNSTTGNIFILYGKEKMLFRLGIPVNIAMIAAILIGAIFSYLDVLRFYSLAFLLINLPMVLIFGFKKSFGFETKEILSFWVPKIALSAMMIGSIWAGSVWLTAILMGVYLILLIISQREDISKTFYFLKKKLKSGKG